MKLATAILIIGALQFSLIIFSGQYVENGTGSLPWESFFNPTSWQSMLFWTIIAGLVATIAFAGSYIGSFVFNKPDLVIFGGLMAIFIGWMTPIVSLWRLISIEGFGNINDSCINCGFNLLSTGNLVGAIAIFPFIIMMFMTLLTWWRSTFEG